MSEAIENAVMTDGTRSDGTHSSGALRGTLAQVKTCLKIKKIAPAKLYNNISQNIFDVTIFVKIFLM